MPRSCLDPLWRSPSTAHHLLIHRAVHARYEGQHCAAPRTECATTERDRTQTRPRSYHQPDDVSPVPLCLLATDGCGREVAFPLDLGDPEAAHALHDT